MPWGEEEAETGKYEWGGFVVSCLGISVLQVIQRGAITSLFPLIQ